MYNNSLAGRRILHWPKHLDIPMEAKDFVQQLMIYYPPKRLGSMFRGGIAAIKGHSYFCNIQWENLLVIQPEFVPTLCGDEDTSYFDGKISY